MPGERNTHRPSLDLAWSGNGTRSARASLCGAIEYRTSVRGLHNLTDKLRCHIGMNKPDEEVRRRMECLLRFRVALVVYGRSLRL
jgi:hypothetical protein